MMKVHGEAQENNTIRIVMVYWSNALQR